MRISVSPIKRDRGASVKRTFSVVIPSNGDDGANWTGPVTVDVRVTNAGSSYLVRGRLTGEASVTCDRCLVRHTTTLSVDIDERFFPERSSVMELVEEDVFPDGDDNEDDSNVFYDDLIDLSQIVSEYAILALPVKAVCREECAGLCSQCGCDLNESTCECEQDDTDPRFALLKDLLPEKED